MMPATLAFIHIQTYSCHPLVDLIDPWIILDHIGSYWIHFWPFEVGVEHVEGSF